MTRSVFGLMRRTVPSASLVTQTLPAPNATPYDSKPIVIRFATRFVRGSILAITLSDRSATQMLPAPYARPNGRPGREIRRATLFVRGSMRTTWPSVKSDVQTEPAAGRSIPDPAPTETVATGVRAGIAARTAAASAILITARL